MISARAHGMSLCPSEQACRFSGHIAYRLPRSESSVLRSHRNYVSLAAASAVTARPGKRSHAHYERPKQQHRTKSYWTPFRRSVRNKYAWHKPGCTWVHSEGDPKATPRDKDCPACTAEEESPYEFSHREMMWQRQRQHMEELHKALQGDPYETLFGWSNRRIHGLWGRYPWSNLPGNMAVALGKELEKQMTNDKGAGKAQGGRKIPVQTEEDEPKAGHPKPLKEEGKPIIEARMSWKTSGFDEIGRPFDESGDLVYDPISNRMIPNRNQERPDSIQGSSNAPTVEYESSKPSVQVEPATSIKEQSRSKAKDPVLEQKQTTDKPTDYMVKEMHEKMAWIDKRIRDFKLKGQESAGADRYHAPKMMTSLERHAAKTEPRATAKRKPSDFVANSFLKQPNDYSSSGESGGAMRPAERPAMHTKASYAPTAKRAMEDSWMNNIKSRNDVAQTEQKIQAEEQKFYANYENNARQKKIDALSKFKSEMDAWSKYKSGMPSLQDTLKASKVKDGNLESKQQLPKSMTYSELMAHRAQIKKVFAKKQEPIKQTEPTMTQQRLHEEVRSQKIAMTAFEDKWRLRSPGLRPSLRIAPKESPRSQIEPQSGSSGSLAYEMVAAEGDMSPKVAEFAENGKWYKKKALHATATDLELKEKDQQLVRAIREAYEGAYGTIDLAHRQGPLLASTASEKSNDRTVGFAPRKTPSSTFEGGAKPSINPIDGTMTSSTPDITPQSVDLADPAASVDLSHQPPHSSTSAETGTSQPATVDHARKSTTRSSTSATVRFTHPRRRVRKEEPVFSGTLSAQRFAIPEIVEILKARGMPDGKDVPSSSPPRQPPTEPSSSSSAGGRDGPRDARRRQAGRKGRRFARKIAFIMSTGAWIAVCCYSTGVVIEYFRSEPAREETARPTWESQQLWWRPREEAKTDKVKAMKGQSRDDVPTRGLTDTPLRGMEYPLMGMLAACVWYLVSGGQ